MGKADGGQDGGGWILYYNPPTYRLGFEQGKTKWLEERQVIKKEQARRTALLARK
jgi:hypothetical protein